MPLFTWNDSYSVGISSIDGQHRKLFDTMNEPHASMSKGTARETTGRLLQDLLAYTRTHFSNEEAMLANVGYPQLDQHRQLHRVMTGRVAEFSARFRRGDAALSVHMLTFLRDWLSDHILREDRSYSGWLAQRDVAVR
jgi:hemerythrin